MKKQFIKKDFLTPENSSKVLGGGDIIIKICLTIEAKQCVVKEAKYCGTGRASAIEVQGPHNPWE